jgi:uncharacterized protein YciI
MYYLLIYDVVPDYRQRREALREAHRTLVREAHARGEIAMAGAHADHEAIDGAVFVFRTSDPMVVQRFVDADPYVQHGLVTRSRIRRWNVIVGG